MIVEEFTIKTDSGNHYTVVKKAFTVGHAPLKKSKETRSTGRFDLITTPEGYGVEELEDGRFEITVTGETGVKI